MKPLVEVKIKFMTRKVVFVFQHARLAWRNCTCSWI